MSRIIATAAALCLLIAAVAAPVAAQDEGAPEEGPAFSVLHPGLAPLDVPYDLWLWKYWQHSADSSATEQPLAMEDCSLAIVDDVLFLPSSNFGQSDTIDCEVRSDQYILAIPGMGWCRSTEPGDTAADIDSCSREGASFHTDPILEIDGVTSPVGGSYWQHLAPFIYTFSEDNADGIPAEPTLIGLAGWAVMIEPLAPGEHTVRVASTVGDGFQSATAETVANITVVDAGAEAADE